MKTYIKYTSVLMLLMALVACQPDHFRTVFPNEKPEMSASLAQTEIRYGVDTIDITVHISSKQTPLSTLTVMVTSGEQETTRLITKEVLRTKDYDYSATLRYPIPFQAGMAEGGAIKVYLTAENVEGDQNTQVIGGCIGHRPAINQLYMISSVINSKVKTTELTLVDADNLIYEATVAYPNTFSVYLSDAKTKFGRMDWNNATIVFGAQNGNVCIAADNTCDPIAVQHEELISINKVIFDAINFTFDVEGTPLTPVTSLDIMADLEASPSSLNDAAAYRGNTIYFGPDETILFSGFTGNLADVLSPDWFTIIDDTHARFLGAEGMYKAYYKTAEDYLVVETMPDAAYPDALWVCGVGMAQPSLSAAAPTTSWNWNSPTDYFCCRKVSTGVYQFTAYMKNEADAEHEGWGSVNFKFFHQRGWGGEESGPDYQMSGLNIVGSSEASNNGNWWATTTPFEGVYRVTLDMNAHTTTYQKIR